MNLAGVKMIVEMQAQLEALRHEAERLAGDLTLARRRAQEAADRLRSAPGSAEIVPLSAARRVRLRVASVVPSDEGARGPIPLGPATAPAAPPSPPARARIPCVHCFALGSRGRCASRSRGAWRASSSSACSRS